MCRFQGVDRNVFPNIGENYYQRHNLLPDQYLLHHSSTALEPKSSILLKHSKFEACMEPLCLRFFFSLIENIFFKTVLDTMSCSGFKLKFFAWVFLPMNFQWSIWFSKMGTGIPLNPLNVLACAFARPKWELCGALVSHSIMLCFAAKRPVSQLSAYRSNLSGTVLNIV